MGQQPPGLGLQQVSSHEDAAPLPKVCVIAVFEPQVGTSEGAHLVHYLPVAQQVNVWNLLGLSLNLTVKQQNGFAQVLLEIDHQGSGDQLGVVDNKVSGITPSQKSAQQDPFKII